MFEGWLGFIVESGGCRRVLYTAALGNKICTSDIFLKSVYCQLGDDLNHRVHQAVIMFFINKLNNQYH